MSLKVYITKKADGVFIVSPLGAIDTETYEILEEKVNSTLALSAKVIVFDMNGVNYITSAGVGVIIKTEAILKQRAGRLTMVNLQPPVKKVFDILKVIPIEQIFKSIDELDNYLAEVQRKFTKE